MINKHMINIQKITTINVDRKHVLCLYTDLGHFSMVMTTQELCALERALEDNVKSCASNIMRHHNISLKRVYIFLQDSSIHCVVETDGAQISCGFMEALLLGIESNAEVLIDKTMLQNEYDPDNLEHQQLVNEILGEEKEFWVARKIETLLKEIDTAIKEERYEEAAVLRDQINMLSQK